jgi:hypothetical protein
MEAIRGNAITFIDRTKLYSKKGKVNTRYLVFLISLNKKHKVN